MAIAVITGLIYVCVLALVVYLVLWVLGTVLGISLPDQVVKIIWVIVALCALLYIVQAVLPHAGLRLGAAPYPHSSALLA